MSDQKRKALKTGLQLVCQLLWVMGLVVGLTGFYLLMKIRQSWLLFSHSYVALSAVLALASAAFLLVSGGLGSWLSLKDSTFLQGLFVYLLVVVFCLQSTASALAYVHITKLDAEIAPLAGVFLNYTGSSQDPNAQAVDVAQEKFECCGVHGFRDWLETSWFNHTDRQRVPRSCCNSTFPSCDGNVHKFWQLYPEGCQKKVMMSFQFVLRLIIWCLPVVLLVEVLLGVIMKQLMNSVQLIHYQVLEGDQP